eukprot:1893646-Heterocapsa_arctica.AAC.1
MTESMAASMPPSSPDSSPGNGVWSAARVRRVPFLRRCSSRARTRREKAVMPSFGIPEGMP